MNTKHRPRARIANIYKAVKVLETKLLYAELEAVENGGTSMENWDAICVRCLLVKSWPTS